MPLFQGLSAFPITPADAQGRVDADGVARLVGRLAQAKVGSIGLLGSTGTYAYLSREERLRAVQAAVERSAGAVPIMVGIGATTTQEAINLGLDAKAAGADAVLLAPVSYLPLSEAEVEQHFTAVAQAVDLPLCIYDNPYTTQFKFSPDLIGRLSRIPNIQAVKTGAPETGAAAMIDDLNAKTAPGFSVGCSGDWRMAQAMIGGAKAWYSVLGGLFPAPVLAIIAAVQAGDVEGAEAQNAKLQPMWDLFTELTSFRVVYAGARIMGLTDAEPPRPLLGLSADDRRRVERVIAELSLA